MCCNNSHKTETAQERKENKKPYKQQTKQYIDEVTKITPMNNCINNVTPFTEKLMKWNISLNLMFIGPCVILVVE